MLKKCAFACAIVAPVLASPALAATVVDLNDWTAESYPAVPGFRAGVWTVAAGGGTVTQSVNGQPTIFYSDFNSYGTVATGNIKVTSGSDDDFIGFVIGFNPGDTTNSAADYLLIDWKAATPKEDSPSRGLAESPRPTNSGRTTTTPAIPTGRLSNWREATRSARPGGPGIRTTSSASISAPTIWSSR